MEDKLDLILSELQALGEGQKMLGERLGSVEVRISSLEERMGSMEERIGSLEEQQTAMRDRLSSLESGQQELNRMVGAIRGNQLEARAGFDGMQHHLAHIKGDIAKIKETIPTFVTQTDLNQTDERLDLHTFQIARIQERVELLERQANS